MWYCGIVLVIFLKIILVQNRMLPSEFYNQSASDDIATSPEDIDDTPRIENNTSSEETNAKGNYKAYGFLNNDKKDGGNSKKNKQKPCSVVVLSNVQNPNVQSLLRKYRYDANGALIPSSVKYFIKLPQEGTETILLPLNDRAFSPVGGFVRYYKEVPPIPQTWS